MDKPCFLKLTRENGTQYRENFALVKRYFPDNKGTFIEYESGGNQIVTEKPEQIDQMLGTLKYESKSTNPGTAKA